MLAVEAGGAVVGVPHQGQERDPPVLLHLFSVSPWGGEHNPVLCWGVGEAKRREKQSLLLVGWT